MRPALYDSQFCVTSLWNGVFVPVVLVHHVTLGLYCVFTFVPYMLRLSIAVDMALSGLAPDPASLVLCKLSQLSWPPVGLEAGDILGVVDM
jgi:hypothetical protein